LIAHAPSLQRAWTKALDDDVRFRRELEERLTTRRGLETHREALLAAVPVHVIEAQATRARERDRPDRSHVVAARWLLDLDDLGPHVGEDAADGGRREQRHLEDANAVQQVVGHWPILHSPRCPTHKIASSR